MPAATAIAFPIGATPFLKLIITIASPFDRISSIAYSIGEMECKAWDSGFRICMTGLEVAIPGLTIASPAFGESTKGFQIEIELLA